MLSMIGMRKAKVLPVPVRALATTSLPSRRGKIAAACTAVMNSYPKPSAMARFVAADTGKDENVFSDRWDEETTPVPREPLCAEDVGAVSSSSSSSSSSAPPCPLLRAPFLPRLPPLALPALLPLPQLCWRLPVSATSSSLAPLEAVPFLAPLPLENSLSLSLPLPLTAALPLLVLLRYGPSSLSPDCPLEFPLPLAPPFRSPFLPPFESPL
mmetsp:Transcript_89235/g.163591  ORF Transcript_89235/g.163591 Transcript_89235/m.163591 type:complete len:212 (+) Transcript_89235:1251-1886(+)